MIAKQICIIKMNNNVNISDNDEKKIINQQIINQKIINQKIDRKLQAKLIEDEIDKYIREDDDNDDEEETDMIQNYITNPETKYIDYHNDSNNESNDETDDDIYYDINGLADISSIQLDLSNYEFYYFGTDSNDLKYYTRIINDTPFYRISYYEKSNEIKLNIIGDCIKTWKINKNEDNSIHFLKL